MKTQRTLLTFATLTTLAATGLSGCSTMRSLFGSRASDEKRSVPIHNPFPDYYAGMDGAKENIVLRSRQGDRSLEVELPNGRGQVNDLIVPMSTAGLGRGPASVDAGDSPDPTLAANRPPSIADREITGRFASNAFGSEGDRREIEGGLGVVPTEDPTPERDSSYLASLDRIKQLYRTSRFEAALLALDEMLKLYPTDPRLYEMRGTLFDRIGQAELALRSWNQALRLDPTNASLRRYIERKQARRGLASP